MVFNNMNPETSIESTNNKQTTNNKQQTNKQTNKQTNDILVFHFIKGTP